MVNRLLFLLIALLATTTQAGNRAPDEFLEPDVAFKLSAQAVEGSRLEIRFDIAPGYYLYRDKLNVEAVPADVKLGPLQVPKGKVKYDETFQKDVETFRDHLTMTLPIAQDVSAPFKLLVGSQGCADKGLCYPPTQRALRVEPASSGAGLLQVSLLSEADGAAWNPGQGATLAESTRAAASATPASEPQRDFAAVLGSRDLLLVAGVFLLGGVLLSFTPCVLPMVPILSSIIVGQSGAVNATRGFRLALVYSLGMAIVYTGFGMAAGLAGEGLAAALQNAWVLGAFALALVALSLSMFGAYELQMPSAVQSRLAHWSGRLQGGRDVGVFLMGAVSAIIVGPCVAAPLAGALVYISQTRDVVLGGVALFAMAIGMSVPLLLVGLSAGSLLPRAGAWMERVKHGFGFVLLGVALWMISPVIPAWAFMVGLAAVALACAVYLGAFERIEHAMTPRRAMTKAAGLLFASVAALQLVGAASGARNPLQPIGHWSGVPGGAALASQRTELAFQPIASVAALDAALRATNRPVMLDFYADWCVSCKEMEGLTFSDDAVRQRLAGMTLLRADVTNNSPADKALMRRFGLFGPPALLFFQPGGDELAQSRVIGYQDARTFLGHLNRIHGPSEIRLSSN
jgi:thioredoxin:protein disulfide reductase